MNKNFIEKKGFREWYKDLDSTYNLMGSGDIDSHFSTVLLSDWFGCKMDLFNSFSTIYHRENIDIDSVRPHTLVGVDVDLTKNKCFGNHVTYLQNPDVISLNKEIPYGCQEYFSKFAGSTLVTILSIYDYDLNKCTKEQLEVLISVDTAFKQFYYNKNTNELFRYYYGEVLEYPEFIEVVEQYPIEYFYNIIKEYKLHESIRVNENGYLETKIELDRLGELFNMDLSLSTERFIPFYNMQTVGKNLYDFKRTVDKDKIFSSACTSNNYVMASVKF
ncbi:hypothetical protein AAK964_05030 [Tissierella praeacuta]|uniref:hypothetical protein n=1 Tax=Tissierella praeacuta TaxID=43131 RepID=UPI00351624C6